MATRVVLWGIQAEGLMRTSTIKERMIRGGRLGLGRDIHEGVLGRGFEEIVLG